MNNAGYDRRLGKRLTPTDGNPPPPRLHTRVSNVPRACALVCLSDAQVPLDTRVRVQALRVCVPFSTLFSGSGG